MKQTNLNINLIIILTFSLLFCSTHLIRISELCHPYNSEKFTIKSTSETIDWSVSLQTAHDSTLLNSQKSPIDSPFLIEQEIKINHSRSMHTSKGEHTVKVTRTKLSNQLLLELEVLNVLSNKSFIPEFYGCQFNDITSEVFIVQNSIQKLPNLRSQSERVHLQNFDVVVKLQLYNQLFKAVQAINEAGFVHSSIETSSISYDPITFNLFITDFSLVQKIGAPMNWQGNSLYWTNDRHASTHAMNLKDDLFSACLFIVDIENREIEDIFTTVSKGEICNFSFKIQEKLKNYVDSAAKSLEIAGYGKLFVDSLDLFSFCNFGELVLKIILNDGKFIEIENIIQKVEGFCQIEKNLIDNWNDYPNYQEINEKKLGEFPNKDIDKSYIFDTKRII